MFKLKIGIKFPIALASCHALIMPWQEARERSYCH